MNIELIIEHLKTEWSQPKEPSSSEPGSDDFELVCSFSERSVTPEQVSQVVGDVPDELSEFWQVVQWAELFKDGEYGQWGLRLLAPEEAVIESARYRKERGHDCQEGDLIIGEFFGDSDLLLIRINQDASDFGIVQVVLPIEARSGWPEVGSTLKEFLAKYYSSEGQKFWE